MKKRVLTVLLVFIFTSLSVMAGIHTKVIDKVNSPQDIKGFDIKQLDNLAKDIRAGILNKTNLVGGHVGSDLGVVEVIIAMHYVFNSPNDKFIFDTSHQTYPHKMITGRKSAFFDPLNNRNISGFSNFNESPHDFFIMGHTSTSISLAEGMAKARDLTGGKYNVVALIGDGSLSGGEALEGLNNAVELNSNFIIIVNDNEMCIAENHGGLYKNLQLLRDTNGTAENNMFKALGYDYLYVADGNDIQTLIDAFKKVQNTNKPTVIHIHTVKGKGYIPAMQDKEKFHWMLPGYMNKKEEPTEVPVETYISVTKDYILNATKSDKRIVAVSPATPMVGGLSSDVRKELGSQYTDVGIAEQHAVGYCSGIAKNGGKPILMVCSSFIQRAYDQLSQDMALNNSPAVILILSYGINGGDATHNGVFDIPLISNIPNIVYMSPSDKEEYLAILDWAVKQDKYPVAIRVPQGEIISTGNKDLTDYSKLNKYKVLSEGSKIAIIAEGSFIKLGKELQKEIKDKLNIDATLINPIYLSGVDTELLNQLKQNHNVVITLENGVLDGGFGEKITRFYSKSDIKVLNYGALKEFTDRVPKEELYNRYRLVPELVINDITDIIPELNNTEKEDTNAVSKDNKTKLEDNVKNNAETKKEKEITDKTNTSTKNNVTKSDNVKKTDNSEVKDEPVIVKPVTKEDLIKNSK